MTNAQLDVFALAEKRLAWIDRRQSVLAQNMANLNTPRYSAQDVKPFRDVLAEQSRLAASAAPSAGTVRDPGLGSRSLAGTAVTLDDQLEKIAETDNAHQLAANLVRKYMGLFRTALGRA